MKKMENKMELPLENLKYINAQLNDCLQDLLALASMEEVSSIDDPTSASEELLCLAVLDTHFEAKNLINRLMGLERERSVLIGGTAGTVIACQERIDTILIYIERITDWGEESNVEFGERHAALASSLEVLMRLYRRREELFSRECTTSTKKAFPSPLHVALVDLDGETLKLFLRFLADQPGQRDHLMHSIESLKLQRKRYLMMNREGRHASGWTVIEKTKKFPTLSNVIVTLIDEEISDTLQKICSPDQSIFKLADHLVFLERRWDSVTIGDSPLTAQEAYDWFVAKQIHLEEVMLEICSICLSDMREGEDDLRTLDCTHFFHRRCISSWLHGKKTCPICRSKQC